MLKPPLRPTSRSQITACVAGGRKVKDVSEELGVDESAVCALMGAMATATRKGAAGASRASWDKIYEIIMAPGSKQVGPGHCAREQRPSEPLPVVFHSYK